MRRREFVISATAIAGILAAPRAARAAGLFSPGQRIPTVEELLLEDEKLTGKDSPFPAHVEMSRKILSAVSGIGTPLAVAQFFDDLRHGKKNKQFSADVSKYAEEWTKIYNPVIVSFFDATKGRKPEGDTTAWCAAFVNWCIQHRKGIDPKNDEARTASAAALSFKNWGQETLDPKVGDLVVFRKKGSAWQGHVGFYIAQDSEAIAVLGGNQQPRRIKAGTYDTPGTGEVNITRYPRQGRSLEFVSFRTHPALH